MAYTNISRLPDNITLQMENSIERITGYIQNKICYKDIEIELEQDNNELKVYLSAQAPVSGIIFHWNSSLEDSVSILGDAWERGYGDLEWRGYVPERVMPWYTLVHEKGKTHGYGVKTGTASMCCWQINRKIITLTMDVRSGGVGVQLKGRKLHVATIVCREGSLEESPFEAAKEFCRLMCDQPRLPKQPVYGSNNWYYAYGNSSAVDILEEAKLLQELSPKGNNRPYIVIDDGWQASHNNCCTGGPWNKGNYRFPDMQLLAKDLSDMKLNPGIWIRPLCTTECYPPVCLLDYGKTRFKDKADHEFYLDPSHPYVLDKVEAMVRGLREWGYKLIKHDFTTFDIFGRWGFEMGKEMTNQGWSFYDNSKTTAEIILDLYQAIRRGAGDDVIIIGCNTISHLSAGIFEIQRTGDDTSGLEWERTRKMGINTLAFRMPQNNTFYAADADCAGVTEHIDWEMNKQWIDLLAASNTPFFVSTDPKRLSNDQKEYLKKAYQSASEIKRDAVPIDWMSTTCPEYWETEHGKKEYNFKKI